MVLQAEEAVRRNLDQADTIHVLEKFGFDPVRLGKLLRLYEAWMKFALGEKNPKRFLFFDPKNGQAVVPTLKEISRRRTRRRPRTLDAATRGLTPSNAHESEGRGWGAETRRQRDEATSFAVAAQGARPRMAMAPSTSRSAPIAPSPRATPTPAMGTAAATAARSRRAFARPLT